MTTRELYNATIKTLYEYGTDEAVDLMNEFKAALDKLDARNEKRKSTETKEKREARERQRIVLNYLCDHQGVQYTRDQIAEALGITPAQVTAACKPIVADNTIFKMVSKVGKSRRVTYSYPVEE